MTLRSRVSFLGLTVFAILITGCHGSSNVKFAAEHQHASLRLVPEGLIPKAWQAGSRLDVDDEARGLSIYCFKVGQTDSMLVVGPTGRTLLFDCGETHPTNSKRYRHVARRIQEITGAKKLDYFVASHFHNDHLGGNTNGLAGLLDKSGITIGTVMDIGDLASQYMKPRSDRKTYLKYDNNMKGENGWLAQGAVDKRISPVFGDGQIDLGSGVSVDIVVFAGKVHAEDEGIHKIVHQANPGHYDRFPASENDLSIGFEITYGHFELFTAGDLTGSAQPGETHTVRHGRETYTNVEEHMVRYWRSMNRESDVEVYCVNHHGSAHSTTTALLTALDPEFMIYSCGGKYGHPSRGVVERGAQTAAQRVTDRLSSSTWNSGQTFRDLKGRVAGEIEIIVDPDGRWYTFNDHLHRAYTDEEEQGSYTATGGRGMDVNEEDNEWYWESD